MINWKVRFKNRLFWVALIPALLLVAQTVASALGYAISLAGLQDKLLDVVNAIFGLLAVLGIVADPTTVGIGDSRRALTYDVPKDDSVIEPYDELFPEAVRDGYPPENS